MTRERHGWRPVLQPRREEMKSCRRRAARSAGPVLVRESQEGGGLPAEGVESGGSGRLVGGKSKVLEIEAGSDGAPGQGVSARRSSRLPPASRDYENRLLGRFGGPEPVLFLLIYLGGGEPQIHLGAR